jgi:hypothetical protein
MDSASESTPPIINCHTHIFTVKDVPPLLAKTIVPWPLYLLIRTNWIASIVKIWIDFLDRLSRRVWYKKIVKGLYEFRMALKRYFILRVIKLLIGFTILLSFFHDLYEPVLKPRLAKQGVTLPFLDTFNEWLDRIGIPTGSLVGTVLLFLILLALFPSGRNLILFLLRQFSRFFKILPGKHMTQLLNRYLSIVRFANYKEQFKVYSRLQLQYPPGSKLVVLPMDMEFMGAGKPARAYDQQMEMLASLKSNHSKEMLPFVFVDPRRTTAGGKEFFSYKVVDNKVILEDCFIKDYIETKDFSGFKIYPALGYFPFDRNFCRYGSMLRIMASLL